MIVAKTCADRVVDLKSALGCVELDPGGLKRIVLREEQCAPVKTAFVWAVFQPKNQEVPGMDIFFLWGRHEVGEVLAFEDHFVLGEQSSICHD